MLSKFLDPKNDVAFRKIFGSEKNKDILIHFLNDMLTFKEGWKVCDVTFLKTVQDPETAAHKTSMVDVLCTDEKGNRYIVEMQVAKEKGFEKRAQYYASKAYISQLHSGGEYENLKEVIFLAIADFVMFPHKKHYKSDHLTLDRESYEHDLKVFSFTFLELPKFRKEIDRLDTMIDMWAYFFKHAEETKEQDIHKFVEPDHIIQRAYEELNRFHWNDAELLSYDQAEKQEGIHKAMLAQKFEEGLAEGEAKGKAVGLAEGEAKKQSEIAKNMLSLGLGIDMITAVTGLSEAEITLLGKGM